MAKYKVKFSCGHEAEVVLYGKMSIRERKLKFFEQKGLCGSCFKEKEQEKIQKEIKTHKKLSEAMGLPELKGTPKQIDWAVVIRGKMISEFMKEMIENNYEPDYLKSLEQAYIYLTNFETSAKFYIDWRGAKPNVICNIVREKLLKDRNMRDRLCLAREKEMKTMPHNDWERAVKMVEELKERAGEGLRFTSSRTGATVWYDEQFDEWVYQLVNDDSMYASDRDLAVELMVKYYFGSK